MTGARAAGLVLDSALRGRHEKGKDKAIRLRVENTKLDPEQQSSVDLTPTPHDENYDDNGFGHAQFRHLTPTHPTGVPNGN